MLMDGKLYTGKVNDRDHRDAVGSVEKLQNEKKIRISSL